MFARTPRTAPVAPFPLRATLNPTTLNRLLALCVVSGLVACDSSSPSETETPEETFGTLSALVNGQRFETSHAYTGRVGSDRHIVGPVTRNSQVHIGLTLSPYDGPGTYTLGEGADHWASGNIPGIGLFHTELGEHSGSVVVTAESPRLQGTFTFTAPRVLTSGGATMVTVAEGKFDLPRVPGH